MINNKNLTGYHLKLIALITMLIDHIAAVAIWRVYEASYSITATMQQSQWIADKLIVWVANHQDGVLLVYDWMRYIGRMAFPIYCFLIVEGFLHTKNVAKYASRLAVFALISEIPFDLALTGEWWNIYYSNVFFTLLLGLLTIWVVSYVEKFFEFWREKGYEPILGWILTGAAGLLIVAITGGFAEMVLWSDYGLGGVLTILVMYLLRRKRELAFVAGVLVLTVFGGNIEILAMLMLYPIMQYDGTRGKNTKYVFYAFYPAHLLILALTCLALGV